MATTDLKEVNLDFHRGEQHATLTAQPTKLGSCDGAELGLGAELGAPALPAKQTFGYKPAQVVCPVCDSRVTTDLTYHITDFTHLSVFLCSVATWPCFMCFLSGIPYCLSVCQKVDHQCPQCKSIVGKHSQFQLSKIFKCIKKK